ncbi:hypothetical protein HMPREF6745_2481 [Prevotella sp. oral taxon 472 str. F0295]|nr:hypothetical protein HMPREF6745_2481 [Prevotella sp. oral taxon 472 str. F0295]
MLINVKVIIFIAIFLVNSKFSYYLCITIQNEIVPRFKTIAQM